MWCTWQPLLDVIGLTGSAGSLHWSTERPWWSSGPVCCCSPQCWLGEDLSFHRSVGKSGFQPRPTESTPDPGSVPPVLPAKYTRSSFLECVTAVVSVRSLRQRVGEAKYLRLNWMCGIACPIGRGPAEARWSCQIWTELPAHRNAIRRRVAPHIELWVVLESKKHLQSFRQMVITCKTFPNTEATPAIPIHRAPKNTPGGRGQHRRY